MTDETTCTCGFPKRNHLKPWASLRREDAAEPLPDQLRADLRHLPVVVNAPWADTEDYLAARARAGSDDLSFTRLSALSDATGCRVEQPTALALGEPDPSVERPWLVLSAVRPTKKEKR